MRTVYLVRLRSPHALRLNTIPSLRTQTEHPTSRSGVRYTPGVRTTVPESKTGINFFSLFSIYIILQRSVKTGSLRTKKTYKNDFRFQMKIWYTAIKIIIAKRVKFTLTIVAKRDTKGVKS